MTPEYFKTFEDLEVYRLAREFRKLMYGVNRKVPSFEGFGLASQIRRAAVSFTNNIAEGHGRWLFWIMSSSSCKRVVRCRICWTI